jgi:SAM-dependent methyltransferase
MKRLLTNLVRSTMDNCVPPLIRDTKWFMYPFYRVWFSGTPQLGRIMEFKQIVHGLTDEEFRRLYETLNGPAIRRLSDTSEETLSWVEERIDAASRSVLDVGCGRGYWLRKLAGRGLTLAACDIFPQGRSDYAEYHVGAVEALPFPDKSFDVVTCFHVLEHVRKLNSALAELTRCCRRQLFIIVPCQRYFKYTLDLHIHFFYSPLYFNAMVGLPKSTCELVAGDIAYCAALEGQGVAAEARV